MSYLISLVVVILFAAILKKAIKRVPMLFYALAVALSVLFLYLFYAGEIASFWRSMLVVFQRCSIALAFFTVVMFIGALPTDSRLRNMLLPLRRELSILGAIFTCGHIVVYAVSFLSRLAEGSFIARIDLLASVLLAILITALLIPLTITSFVAVSKRMKAETWKRVQMLAYAFFVLIYVHVILIMLPTALAGSSSSLTNCIVYTLLFGSYIIMRIHKALVAGKAAGAAGLQSSQGGS